LKASAKEATLALSPGAMNFWDFLRRIEREFSGKMLLNLAMDK